MSTIFEKHEDFLKHKAKEIKIKDGILFRGTINRGKGDYNSNRDKGNAAEIWEKAPRRYLYITKELTERQRGWNDIRNEDGLNKNGYDVTGRFYKNYMYHLYGMESAIVNNQFETWEKLSHEDSLEFFQNKAALARINCGKDYGPITTSPNRLKDLIKCNSDLLKKQILLLDADIIVCCGSSADILEFVDEIYPNADWIWNDGLHKGIHYSEKIKKIVVHSYHPSYFGISSKDFYEDTIKPFAEFIKKHPEFRTFR